MSVSFFKKSPIGNFNTSRFIFFSFKTRGHTHNKKDGTGEETIARNFLKGGKNMVIDLASPRKPCPGPAVEKAASQAAAPHGSLTRHSWQHSHWVWCGAGRESCLSTSSIPKSFPQFQVPDLGDSRHGWWCPGRGIR